MTFLEVRRLRCRRTTGSCNAQDRRRAFPRRRCTAATTVLTSKRCGPCRGERPRPSASFVVDCSGLLATRGWPGSRNHCRRLPRPAADSVEAAAFAGRPAESLARPWLLSAQQALHFAVARAATAGSSVIDLESRRPSTSRDFTLAVSPTEISKPLPRLMAWPSGLFRRSPCRPAIRPLTRCRYKTRSRGSG